MRSSLIIDPEKLEHLAGANRESYSRALPFPNIVIDDFLPEEILDQVIAEFPGPEEVDWQNFNNPAEKKMALKDEKQMGTVSRALFHELNSSLFVEFIENLTGIEGLIPDPHLWGGGLHQITRGGYLKIHADFNRYTRLRLDRRVNLLVYLNRDWKKEYGGQLELWGKDMTRCEKSIQPVFNRCVIFSTTDSSYHGHPEPLNCPEGQTRKSIALYYYSNGRPAEEVSPLHTTLFQRRPGEGVGASVFSLLTRLTPPILIEAQNHLKKTLSRKRSR